MNKRLYALLAISLTIILSSCSFISEQKEKDIPIVHPDLSLYDTTYKVGRSDGNPFIIKASLLEIYKDDNKAFGTDVTFIRYDENSNIELEGRADSVEINTKKDDAILSGNVIVDIKNEGLQINCDSINWDNSNSILDSNDGVVNVIWDQSNSIEGYGFSGNLNTRIFELSTIKDGKINEKN